MKLRGKVRKFDIQKIHIDKDSFGGTTISYVINGQYIERNIPFVYLDSILMSISDDIKIFCDDSYIVKK